jgi:hypothetical protein
MNFVLMADVNTLPRYLACCALPQSLLPIGSYGSKAAAPIIQPRGCFTPITDTKLDDRRGS